MEDDPKYTWQQACALGIVKTYIFVGEYWHPNVSRSRQLHIPARNEADAWRELERHSGDFINNRLIRIDDTPVVPPRHRLGVLS